MNCFLSAFIVAIVFRQTKARCGTYIAGNTIFTFFWCLILALSSFGLYGLYAPNLYVYVISYASVIVFNIPTLSSRNKNCFLLAKNDINGDFSFPMLLIGHAISYYFALPYLRKSIEFIMKNGFSAIRGVELEFIGQSTYIALGFQWICLPFFTVTIIFSAINIALGRKSSMLFLLAILDTFAYVILYGGRYIILKFLFYVFAALIIVNGGKVWKIVRKQKKVILFGVITVLFLMYLTSLRSLSHMDFLGNIVGYYVGSLSLLTQLVEQNVQGDYLGYGHMTFGFIINLFQAAAKLLLGWEYNGSDTIFTSFAGDYFQIGENIKTNALPTFLYALILDYGKYFFFIGVLLLASFSFSIEKNFYKKPTIRNFAIYLFILYNIFDTILVYDYISPGTFVVFILLIFLTKDPDNFKSNKL